MKWIKYFYRRSCTWARLRRFWHTLLCFHCTVDIIEPDGATTIMCVCGAIWGADNRSEATKRSVDWIIKTNNK